MTIHWGSSALLPDFSPASLFAAGEQGLWYDPDEIVTLYQDAAGTTQVTAAGQGVGRILDRSGNNNYASQSVAADEPTYQVSPDRLAIGASDRLIVTVPVGGFVGTMILSTPEGTAAYGVNIPAGSFDIGGVAGLYFPGTAITGQLIRNGAMTDSEIAQTISYMRAQGGGFNYGGVTNFANYWRDQTRITSFPLVDTSSGTNFANAWQNCAGLTSLPLLNFSNATSLLQAFSTCTSLITFPLIDTSNVTNFQQAWVNNFALTSFPLLNTSNGTNFRGTWQNTYALTNFPLLDVSSGTNFTNTWRGCTFVDFPALNLGNSTTFDSTWRDAVALTNFPANMFDTVTATNFTNAFASTNLSQTSIDNILVSIETAGTSNGTFNQSGGSAPSATGEAAIDALRARGWTVTVTGGY